MIDLTMTAYIVFAHGSSVESANEAVRTAARDAAERGGWRDHVAAFLGGGRPTLPEAVTELTARGATSIVVIPYFLTSGLHLERDLPALVAEVKQSHRGLEIEVTPPLDGHPGLLHALVDRAKASCKPA
jgi:sirohydrochlorin ferrochelatase